MPLLNLQGFNESALRALNMAAAIARGRDAAAISTEHLLLALVNQSHGQARHRLANDHGVDLADLRAALEPTVAASRATPPGATTVRLDDNTVMPLTESASTCLIDAQRRSFGHGRPRADTAQVLDAIAASQTPAGAILRRFGLDETGLAPGHGLAPALRALPLPLATNVMSEADLPSDLIERARLDALPPIEPRPELARRLLQWLANPQRPIVALVGEPGVGKRSLIFELAGRLHDRWQQAAADPPPEWWPADLQFIDLAESSDELPLAVVTALNDGGVLALANADRLVATDQPAAISAMLGQLGRLARDTPDRRLIITLSPSGHARLAVSDPWLANHLTTITIEPTSPPVTRAIATRHLERLRRTFDARITDAAVAAAVNLAETCLPGAGPGAAIRLLEDAAAAARVDNAIGSAESSLVVDEATVAAVVRDQTGIPVSHLLGPERARLATLETTLGQRVIGQPEALAAVANAVRRARVGLHDGRRPIGSMLFLGPTGVGKTEVARALAETLFGSRDALIQIDMSDYMERHAVARLVGAPPGYVGHEAGGELTERVRARPASVVLFDEVEKAHPDVFNLLLQLLDEGWLTDGQSRRVDFRHAIVILTSNLGARLILDALRDSDSADAEPAAPTTLSAATREAVMAIVRATFRPELLNRLDATVLFNPLGPTERGYVLDRFLAELTTQLQDGVGVNLTVTPIARDWLLAQAGDLEYGARPLRRCVDQRLRDELSRQIVADTIGRGDTVAVDVAGERLSFRVTG